MSKKSAFLVVFQATIGGQLVQTDFSTIKDPLNSRQVRRDCEAVARASFEKFAADLGLTFPSTDPIKCVEIVEIREEDGHTEALARKAGPAGLNGNGN